MTGRNRLRDKDVCKVCGNPNDEGGCKPIKGGRMTVCKNDGTGRAVEGGYLHITPTMSLKTIHGRKVE